jgi:hypothetical protein
LTHLLPREIDHLAILFAQVVRGELMVDVALSRFMAQAYKNVGSWFEKHATLEERTFMLAVAVFNGAKYQTVIDGQASLHSHLKQPTTEHDSPTAESVFGKTRTERVEEACARLVRGYEQTEFGRSSVELVQLNNPTLQPAVLRYVWQEYDKFRKPLLEWLRDLGHHPSFDIRARVAAAVGELTKYDFDYVKTMVLSVWAMQNDSKSRSAVSLALGIPAWEGEFAPEVLGLLHYWSALDNHGLRQAAAEAYGGLVGQRFPDIALHNLETIARESDDFHLFLTVSQSVVTLFDTGRFAADNYSKVLDALINWTSTHFPDAGVHGEN